MLFAIELIIALVWASICLNFWSNKMDSWWIYGLVLGCVCALLILAVLFVDALRKQPVSWGVYIAFTICFALFCGYVVCADSTRLTYFTLWLLTVIALGLAIYAFCNDYYMDVFNTLIIVLTCALGVLIGFIICSDLDIFLMILITVPIVVFGVYLAYDMRTNVRSSLFDHEEEDPISGAVRIWIETVLVFCRFGELVGKMFTKNNLAR